MRSHAVALLLTVWATLSYALHESDAGVVDWHKRLIGVPNAGSSHTAPTFHRVQKEKNTRSVVLTATRSNVLAAVDPVNGSIAWRYVYEPRDTIVTFQKRGPVVTSLSGAGGAVLRSFDVLNGDLLLEKQLHNLDEGLLIQPSHLGAFIAFGNGTEDHFVLTNGRTVQYISGSEAVWSWASNDQGSQVMYSNIYVTDEAVFIVGLASSFASYTLHVTALSPSTGQVISTSHIPSSISNGLTDFLVLPGNIVWLESGSIHSFTLSPSLKGKPAVSKAAATYERFVDVDLGAHGMLVAVKSDGSGQVLKCGTKGVEVVQDFEDSASSQVKIESLYSGGLDKDGYPYVARLYYSLLLKFASAEIFSPHLADGKGLVAGYSFPFDTNTHGIITHVAMDSANPAPTTVLGRLFLTTSTGAVQLWQQDALQWTREEGLAELNAVEFVELPELVSVLSTESRGEEEGFLGRLTRQIKDAKDLPNYLIRFAKRFATGSYESATSSAAGSPSTAHAPAGSSSSSSTAAAVPFRDAFGFRQVLVVATPYGKIYGIDTSGGQVIWSRILGIGAKASERGAKVVPVEEKMFVLKTVADGDDGSSGAGVEVAGAEVVLIAKSTSEETTSEDIVLFHFNALTGEDVSKASPSKEPLQGSLITSGSVMDVYLLQTLEKRVVVVLDSKLKVHLYPNDAASKDIFTASASSLSVPLRMVTSNGQRRLVGHQFTKLNLRSSSESEAEINAYPTWTLSLPEGHDIQSIVPPTRGPIASIGKVLGNRTTLYKYLNPRVVVMLTTPHSPASATASSSKTMCGLYLIDSVKGSVVYQTMLPAAGGGGCDVKAAFTENWLVYHYYDDEYQGEGQTKGYRMVTVELYEGKQVDDKTSSSDMTSYSDSILDITAYEQSFVYPHAISAITTTTTKFGITSKDIIVANANNKIQSFSRRLLNPRRPLNRKPTAEEQEEFLIQYEPLLPDDSKKVLSHTYDVADTRKIITTPALLESTSLVFAYGLDLFLTRVAPSNTFDVLNENFNKVQLVLTVLGLAAAILITRPMVMKKKLKEKWYQ